MKQAASPAVSGHRQENQPGFRQRGLGVPLGVAIQAWLLALAILSGEAVEVNPSSAQSHCLWRIEGQHCSVYLLGSMHFLKSDSYPLAAPIESAFSRAEVVLFETDIGQMQEPATQQKVLVQCMLPAGQTLEGQLSTTIFASFSNHVAEAGLPLMIFAQMKPALAAMTLELLGIQKLGFDPNQGVDMHFYKLAREKNKSIMPLETVEFQLDLLTGFSKEEGELMMKTTLDEIDTTKKDLGEMVQAWQTGDTVVLATLLNRMEKEAPALFKRMVTDRSRHWAPKIEELLRGNKTALVVVGAGHLVGKDGLVELLRANGAKTVQE